MELDYHRARELVLAALRDCPAGHSTYSEIAKLAGGRACGMSYEAVRDAVQVMESEGALEVDRVSRPNIIRLPSEL